jgi:hypothetical protein
MAVGFWLGFWFWWEHPGAKLGRFSPPWPWWAPRGTSHQPPSGVVGGGPWVTRRCPRRCGADLSRGVPAEISGWIDRAVAARLGPAKIKKGTPLRLKITSTTDLPI